MAIYRLKPCTGDCPENFDESVCASRGCVNSIDNYIFTTIQRYWIGPNVLMNGIPIKTGDKLDVTFYDPPVKVDGVYKFSKVTVQDFVGFEPENEGDEPEAVENDAVGSYDNNFGCTPDPDNEGQFIKFQRPGTHIMNGDLTEASIVDGEVIVDTFYRLVIS